MSESFSGPTTDAQQARQREIIDNPPRIEADYSESNVRAAKIHTAKLMTTASGGARSPSPDDVNLSDIPEMVVTLMGCHPELYEKVADVSVTLMASSSLPRRELELVVLRADWLCQSPYNFGEHVPIAKRFGITDAEIERVKRGADAQGWSEHDQALVRAAEELHVDSMLSDATWETLAKTYSDKQIFELIVLVGQFTLVTYFQNSLRLKLSENNAGLESI